MPDERAALLQDLLPHRFDVAEGQVSCCEELLRLAWRSNDAARRIGMSGETTWHCFARLAMHDTVVMQENQTLIMELERWSLELQRYRPDDWNRFSAVLLRCLADEPRIRLQMWM